MEAVFFFGFVLRRSVNCCSLQTTGWQIDTYHKACIFLVYTCLVDTMTSRRREADCWFPACQNMTERDLSLISLFWAIRMRSMSLLSVWNWSGGCSAVHRLRGHYDTSLGRSESLLFRLSLNAFSHCHLLAIRGSEFLFKVNWGGDPFLGLLIGFLTFSNLLPTCFRRSATFLKNNR